MDSSQRNSSDSSENIRIPSVSSGSNQMISKLSDVAEGVPPTKENSLTRLMTAINNEPYRQDSFDQYSDYSFEGYDVVSDESEPVPVVTTPAADASSMPTARGSDGGQQDHGDEEASSGSLGGKEEEPDSACMIDDSGNNNLQQQVPSSSAGARITTASDGRNHADEEAEEGSLSGEPTVEIERLELPPPRQILGSGSDLQSIGSNFPVEAHRAEQGLGPGPTSTTEAIQGLGAIQGLADMDPTPQPNIARAQHGDVIIVDDSEDDDEDPDLAERGPNDDPNDPPILGGLPPGALQDAFGEAFGMGFLGLSPATNEEMINSLVNERKLTSQRLIDAFKKLDRKQYAPSDEQDLAYEDMPIRSGHFHLSAPSMYAEVMENLMPIDSEMSFLNVGSGTGYLSSVVDEMLGPRGLNHGLEIHTDLVKFAQLTANKNGFSRIVFKQGNFKCLDINHAKHMRYDRVYIGAAAPGDCNDYFNLLNIGGIMVGPFEAEHGGQQHLRKIQRLSQTEFRMTSIKIVQFAKLQVPEEDAEKIVLRAPVWSPSMHRHQPIQMQKGIRNLLGCVESHRSTAGNIPKEIWIQNVFPWMGRKFFDMSAPAALPEGVAATLTTVNESGEKDEAVPLIQVVSSSDNADSRAIANEVNANNINSNNAAAVGSKIDDKASEIESKTSSEAPPPIPADEFAATGRPAPSSSSPSSRPSGAQPGNEPSDTLVSNTDDDDVTPNLAVAGPVTATSSNLNSSSGNSQGTPPINENAVVDSAAEDETITANPDAIEVPSPRPDAWSDATSSPRRSGNEHVGPNPDFFRTTYEAKICPVSQMQIEDINLADQPLGFRETNVGRTLQALLAVIRHRTRQEERDAVAAGLNIARGPGPGIGFDGARNQAAAGAGVGPDNQAGGLGAPPRPIPNPFGFGPFGAAANLFPGRRAADGPLPPLAAQGRRARQQAQEAAAAAAGAVLNPVIHEFDELLGDATGAPPPARRVWGPPANEQSEDGWPPGFQIPGAAVRQRDSVESINSSDLHTAESGDGRPSVSSDGQLPTSQLAWEHIRMPPQGEVLVNDAPAASSSSDRVHRLPARYVDPSPFSSTSHSEVFHDAHQGDDNDMAEEAYHSDGASVGES